MPSKPDFTSPTAVLATKGNIVADPSQAAAYAQGSGDPSGPTQLLAGATLLAANRVLADTGNLAAGDYLVEWDIKASDVPGATKTILVKHRVAADNADVNNLGAVYYSLQPDKGGGAGSTIITAQANESVTVVQGASAGSAAATAAVQLRVTPAPGVPTVT